MTLLFAFFDILFRMFAIVGIYLVGRAFVKQAKAGFPMFNPAGSWQSDDPDTCIYVIYKYGEDIADDSIVLCDNHKSELDKFRNVTHIEQQQTDEYTCVLCS